MQRIHRLSLGFLLAAVLIATFFGTVSIGHAQGPNPLPVIKTDPYKNDGELIRKGLPVDDSKQPILPNIIYPFLPDGGMIDNAGAAELSNAPNIGAVESIVLFIANAFKREGSAGSTGDMLWKLTLSITVFGLIFSGFMTFKGVMQGKKGPGEAIVHLILKLSLCIFLAHSLIPNLPPLLIGLTNAVTNGIDKWFAHSSANGRLTGKEATNNLMAMLNTKIAAGQAAALQVYNKIMEASAQMATQDPATAEAMKFFQEKMAADDQVKLALGGKTTSTTFTGLFQWQSSGARLSDLYKGKVQEMLDDGKSAREISAEISTAAGKPVTIIVNRSKMYLEEAFKATDVQNRPGSAAMIEAVMKSPQGIDVSSFTLPNRVVSISAYVAFAYLSISIWGMGFAAMCWLMLYSMPEEWNFQGVLASGIKAILGVVLSAVLISIYVGSSLHLAVNKSDKAIDTVWDDAQNIAATAKTAVADVLNHPLDAALNGGKALIEHGVFGDTTAKFYSFFSGMTLEQFIMGMLVLTAPAQAAAMMKGANGIGESGAKALTANGAGGQGFMAQVFGQKGTGSGASLANSSGAAGSIMQGGDVSGGIDRSAMLRPKTPE